MATKSTIKKSMSKAMMTNEQFSTLSSMICNDAMTLSRDVLNRIFNAQTDLDNACGYLPTLTIKEYRAYYDRMGLAKRAVQIWPDECWQSFPEIFESEAPEDTEFEKEWKLLQTQLNLYSYLHRIDILSGIGAYGILLLGLDDGKRLSDPVDGINPKTGEVISTTKRKLLYLRAFDESVLTVNSSETDLTSPRFGMPTSYKIQYQQAGPSPITVPYDIHWTRVVHVADNRECSEVYGISRLQCLFDNLYDVKKVSGSSAEMFWKGGFPGYAFELTPEAIAMGAEIDAESVKEQMLLWSQGLQRWLALTGVTTKSLTPQVADPTGHVDVHLKLVAVSLGVPYRVLLGSEEAKLASVQDKRTWNGRVAKRQNGYITPMLIRPFINRLIALGCLPEPKEPYSVEWPDLNASTDDDVAKIALNRTESFAKYVEGGVDALIPPRQFFTIIHKMSDSEAENILKEQEKYEGDLSPEPEPKPGQGNEPPTE